MCIFASAKLYTHSKHFGYLVITPRKDCTAVNSPLTSLIANEGWHNYHHTISKDYRHGHKWGTRPVWFIEKLFLVSRG